VHRAAHRAGKHARECEALGTAKLAHLRERAEKGDVQAIVHLGSAYKCAYLRLAKDSAAAVSWFERAADLGDADAQYILGCAYRDGDGIEQDHAESLRRFRKAAEQGYAAAQCAIGGAYYNGHGVPVDFKRAAHYFRLGAQAGHAGSMRILGVCYLNGDCVARSLPTARAWLLSARRLGCNAAEVSDLLAAVDAAEAKASVGVGKTGAGAGSGAIKRASPDWPPYKQRICVVCDAPALKANFDCLDCRCAFYCSAAHRTEHLATGGHADECGALCAEALERWRKGAEGGNAQFAAVLGSAYSFGNCRLAKDASAAASWYKRAADLGDTMAQCNLGVLYRDGEGVEQDFAEALRRFRQAAEKGDAVAQNEVGRAYYLGCGVPVDFERAVHYYRLGAERGNALAMLNLGLSYRDGTGVARSLADARKWFLCAKAAGHPNPALIDDELAKLNARAAASGAALAATLAAREA
jgi:TPR repeat protein